MDPYLQPCPECSETLDCPGSDGTVVCPECRAAWWVSWDVEGATFSPLDPPDWREVEGDLRFHDNC